MKEKNQMLELIYDEELVHQAELLLESNSIFNLSNIGSNLYVGNVKDGKIYEVEIQSPFAKKQKASCDCVFFTQHKICKHIIGLLFAIRNEIKTKQETKEVIGEKSKQKLTSLNINQMLDEINPCWI
ncbi:MAG: hypothetical protein IPO92_19050 [Saprospiraceae bacterium]|nr:hypothetical protein [Saprospiraceae bacterium]